MAVLLQEKAVTIKELNAFGGTFLQDAHHSFIIHSCTWKIMAICTLQMNFICLVFTMYISQESIGIWTCSGEGGTCTHYLLREINHRCSYGS